MCEMTDNRLFPWEDPAGSLPPPSTRDQGVDDGGVTSTKVYTRIIELLMSIYTAEFN